MSNLRMLFTNEIDSATLSTPGGTPPEASLPVTNLQKYGNSRVMRSTYLSDTQILGEWSTSRWVSACVLWRHNLDGAATMRLELFDDVGQTGNTVYDSGEISALPIKALNELDWGVEPLGAGPFSNAEVKYSTMWFDQTIARSFRITIKSVGNPDGYIDLGRVYMGTYLSPSTNLSFGHGLILVDETEHTITVGGSLWSDAGAKYRVLSFNLDWLSNVDRPRFVEAIRRTGKQQDVFISIYPETGGQLEQDYAFAAKLVNNPTFSPNRPRNFITQYEYQEA